MLLKRLASKAPRAFPTLARGFKHVQNMHDERMRAEIQQKQDGGLQVATTDRIYKPSETIEFNRTGEVLLYSCEPLKHTEIYFKYPYVFYESLIPASFFMYYMNPFGMSWYFNSIWLVAMNTRTQPPSFPNPSLVAKSNLLLRA